MEKLHIVERQQQKAAEYIRAFYSDLFYQMCKDNGCHIGDVPDSRFMDSDVALIEYISEGFCSVWFVTEMQEVLADKYQELGQLFNDSNVTREWDNHGRTVKMTIMSDTWEAAIVKAALEGAVAGSERYTTKYGIDSNEE
jgi:hypothetical protein